MSYRGFLIKSEWVSQYQWDANMNGFIALGTRKTYKIIDSASSLIYGIKLSLESAKKAIDRNGKRWHKVD
jgi:hypothetical protein